MTFITWQRRRLFVVESSECVGIPLGSAFKGFRLDERTSAAKADVAYSDGGTTEVEPFPKADPVSSNPVQRPHAVSG